MFLLKIISVIKSFTKIITIINEKKILETSFNYIEVCIKNENNEDTVMRDLFQISLYIS